MGTANGKLCCMGGKQHRYPKANIISRPSHRDFSEDAVEALNEDSFLTQPPEVWEARIGVAFIHDELLQRYTQSQKRTATKNSRLQKWHRMTTFGLDDDLKSRVIISKRSPDHFVFSQYAKVGLRNFSEAYPELFRSRLSKGPPP